MFPMSIQNKIRLARLLIAALMVPSASANFAPAVVKEIPPEVKVTTRRDGSVTHFYVENQERCEITMTFEMGLVNLKSTARLPYTTTFPPQTVTEAFVLEPINTEAKWEYTYTNYYKLGSAQAKHNDSYAYRLPYAPGTRYKVTQAFGGSFSHKGSNLYAIDWQMAEGTPVYAARGGVVVRTKDDSTTGGGSLKFDPFNNYVLIRHDDGTLGHYCHLKKNGITVVPGQVVKPGDLIAHSGNTGFSSGPHLHFCVFMTLDGKRRVSIPIKFKTADEPSTVLTEGRRYKAPDVETASTPGAVPVTARAL
jgi:murein DD-endopeptidase MepM/ murein hydrolase activator NlpD